MRGLRGTFLYAGFGCALRKPDRIKCSFITRFKFIHVSALLLFPDAEFLLRFMSCAASVYKRMIGVTVQMCASTLLSTQEIRSDWISVQSSLPNIFVLFLFLDENVSRFSSLFLSFKKSVSSRFSLWTIFLRKCWIQMFFINDMNTENKINFIFRE